MVVERVKCPGSGQEYLAGSYNCPVCKEGFGSRFPGTKVHEHTWLPQPKGWVHPKPIR